ncbi:MAG: [protein-PII] uridylyltransferase [Candidatus Methylacidiphilales bacterium]
MSAHLEKVLRHAERRLLETAYGSPADTLDIYRKFLKLEEHRLRLAHRAGEGGRDFVRKRSELMTVVLRRMFQDCLKNSQKSNSSDAWTDKIALIAVGGFGRDELCPQSDIDINFLYEKRGGDRNGRRFVEDIIEQVLYMLWDIGLKVGHATRSIEDTIQAGREDLQTRTSLLEARLITGSESLFEEFERRFRRMCIQGKETAYLEWRMEDQAARHTKFEGTVFVQEPNIKSGCGGLRDYHNLLWMGLVKGDLGSTLALQHEGLMSATERKHLEQAYDFLLRVRNELHFQQKHAGDQLTLKAQGLIANAFRYPQRTVVRRIEAFMRDYYHHSRNMFLTANLVSRRLAGEVKKTPRLWKILPKRARAVEVIDGFLIEGGEMHAERPTIFSEDQRRLLRAFQIMQQRDVILGPELQQAIAERAPKIPYKFLWLDDVRTMLFDILSKKGKVGRIVRAMHETGLLGRLIPEFRPLTCLVQHEFYHRYTADEHTLQCLEQLDRVFDDPKDSFSKYRPLFHCCNEPDILYLALILHDVGKASNAKHHSEQSAQLAARFARRMKIRGRRLRDLVFLIDHHMTLSEFAQRRNLDDPQTIREFARIVHDEERLDMLMLLAFADSQGTSGTTSYTEWRELLVWQLYRLTRDLLRQGEEFLARAEQDRAEVIDRVRASLPRDISSEEMMVHFGSLPPSYLTRTNEPLLAEHLKLVHEFFKAQVEVDADPLAPAIGWNDRPSANHSEVTVVTWNRAWLFTKIVGAFSVAELNILSANILTRDDDIVIDTFRVANQRGEAASDRRDRETFQKTLKASLTQPDFDFGAILAEIKARARSKGPREEIFPIRLQLDNESSDAFTLLHVQAPDRIGFLYDLSLCLAELGVDITYAHITTEKGAALDTFYLMDSNGGQIRSETRQQLVLRALKEALT